MPSDGRLYFIELNTLSRLDIQFTPEEITLSRTPAQSVLQVIGKNTPNYQFAGGETLLALQLDFYAQEEHRRDVMDRVKWLESLQYNDGFKSPPSLVKLIFGDLFRDDIWNVKSVVAKVSQFNRTRGYMPQQAYVDVILALDVKERSADYVRNEYSGSTNSTARFV